jgi:hypothetical protein
MHIKFSLGLGNLHLANLTIFLLTSKNSNRKYQWRAQYGSYPMKQILKLQDCFANTNWNMFPGILVDTIVTWWMNLWRSCKGLCLWSSTSWQRWRVFVSSPRVERWMESFPAFGTMGSARERRENDQVLQLLRGCHGNYRTAITL